MARRSRRRKVAVRRLRQYVKGKRKYTISMRRIRRRGRRSVTYYRRKKNPDRADVVFSWIDYGKRHGLSWDEVNRGTKIVEGDYEYYDRIGFDGLKQHITAPADYSDPLPNKKFTFKKFKKRNPHGSDTWTETKRLLILNGNSNHVVFKNKEGNGYRFVYRNKSSFAPTLEKAKDMLSAIAEFGRWPG